MILEICWKQDEQGAERIKEKPYFESILLFYGQRSLCLTYQQKNKELKLSERFGD